MPNCAIWYYMTKTPSDWSLDRVASSPTGQYWLVVKTLCREYRPQYCMKPCQTWASGSMWLWFKLGPCSIQSYWSAVVSLIVSSGQITLTLISGTVYLQKWWCGIHMVLSDYGQKSFNVRPTWLCSWLVNTDQRSRSCICDMGQSIVCGNAKLYHMLLYKHDSMWCNVGSSGIKPNWSVLTSGQDLV